MLYQNQNILVGTVMKTTYWVKELILGKSWICFFYIVSDLDGKKGHIFFGQKMEIPNIVDGVKLLVWSHFNFYCNFRRFVFWKLQVYIISRKSYLHVLSHSHCFKMEMNEEKPSKFQFHFPVLLVPYLMKKQLSEKSFVFGLPR